MVILNRCLCFKKEQEVRINLAKTAENVEICWCRDGENEIHRSLASDDGFVEINLGTLAVGLYFFDVYSGDETLSEQFIVYQRQYPIPNINRNGIIYQIFVDRFYKGEGETQPRPDSVYAQDWYNTPVEYPERPGAFIRNNNFYGGNLWGVAEKLDYIKSLGVNAIYLCPIFEAYSNHKYDTGDYMKVDGGFGGDPALENLIAQAKKRDIVIILDGVFNHTGDNSVYFDKYGKYGNGAYSNPDSPYREWFSFTDYPDGYDCWWGIDVLPKIIPCESFIDFICNTVAEKYMNMGIGGFRLDVVDELDKELVEKLAFSVKKHNGYLLGEVWEDASNKTAYGARREYFLGKQLDGVMNYPLREGIIDFLLWKNSVLLKNTLKTLILHYPPECLAYSMSFLGSHDTERIITVLAGEFCGEYTNRELSEKTMSESEYNNGIKLMKIAFTMLFSLVGIPSIYYGDECGVQGYRDPFNRRPMPWGLGNNELLKWVQTLGKLRTDGVFGAEPDLIESDDKTLHYISGDAMVFVNMDDKERTIEFAVKRRDIEGNEYERKATAKPFSCLLLLCQND